MEEFNYNEKMEELRNKIDYEKLEGFIENEFIPKNIHSRKNYGSINKNKNKNKKFEFIYLNSIINLSFKDNETQYIIYYLNNKGIIICGDNKQANFDIPVCYRDAKFKTKIEVEEEIELFKLYKETNDKKIRDELVKRNIGLAKSIAKKNFIYYNYDADDLESYALEALVIAVERFDYTLGNSFSTYAFCVIDNYIKKAILNNVSNRGFRIYQYYFKIYYFIKRVEDIYGTSIKEDISLVQIVLDLLIDSNTISLDQRDYFEKLVLSIYALPYEEIDYDVVHDGGISNVEDEMVLALIKDIIIKFINKKCTPNQRNVFIKRFGLDDEEPLTLLQLKQIIGISRSRGLQLEQVVIRKLKKYFNGWPIDDYSYEDLGQTYLNGKKLYKKHNF